MYEEINNFLCEIHATETFQTVVQKLFGEFFLMPPQKVLNSVTVIFNG
jgi:hypothetical protein